MGITRKQGYGLAPSSKLIECNPSCKANKIPSFQDLRNAILHANATQTCKRTENVEIELTLKCFVGRSLVSYRPTYAKNWLPAVSEARAG